jgi:hypothetical protein
MCSEILLALVAVDHPAERVRRNAISAPALKFHGMAESGGWPEFRNSKFEIRNRQP